MDMCDYGCGKEASFQLKNGKWCCSKSANSCPKNRRKISEGKKGKKRPKQSEVMKAKGDNHPSKRPEVRKKISESGKALGDNHPTKRPEVRKKMSESGKAKGDSHSSKRPEVRKKMSEGRKGKKRSPFTDEWRENIGKAQKALGDNHPFKRLDVRKGISERSKGDNNPAKRPEVRKKLSEGKKGKKRPPFTDEWRENISKVTKGENNPNWKGGISCEPYCEVWTDKEYKNWLKYERDEGKCQNPNCNHKTTKLCLHHINYDKKDCRPINLITICMSCNARANYDREWHEAYYNEIIRRKYLK